MRLEICRRAADNMLPTQYDASMPIDSVPYLDGRYIMVVRGLRAGIVAASTAVLVVASGFAGCDSESSDSPICPDSALSASSIAIAHTVLLVKQKTFC